MAEVTYYVALPFVAADDGIEATECFNPIAVVMRAEALSRKQGHVGAVALSPSTLSRDHVTQKRLGIDCSVGHGGIGQRYLFAQIMVAGEAGDY